MKILITGANGFTSSHLVRYLQQNPELKIYCTTRNQPENANSIICDLTDYNSVNNLIQEIKPDQIYHLAGSFSNDYHTDYANNVLSSKYVLDSLIKNKLSCRVLLIGSAAEYGFIKEEDNPVKEDHPLNPVSIYGLTKVYQTHLMKFYCQVYDLDIVMARPFNLLGENISRQLFIGRVYQQIEEYKSWFENVLNDKANSFISEHGEVQKWVGGIDKERAQQSLDEVIEYLNSLKK